MRGSEGVGGLGGTKAWREKLNSGVLAVFVKELPDT